jgi:hypothetical protein
MPRAPLLPGRFAYGKSSVVRVFFAVSERSEAPRKAARRPPRKGPRSGPPRKAAVGGRPAYSSRPALTDIFGLVSVSTGVNS